MRNKKGFTLVEIIVVIVILGILLAIAIPNVINYIDKANEKADGLAVRNVYLAAVSATAEYYAKEHKAPAQGDISAEVIKLAGLANLTGYTINFEGNNVSSVVLASTASATKKTVTYTPGTGVTFDDPAPANPGA